MTHPFVRLKRCLTSYIAGFMVLSWSALNPCTCLIFSRIHRKKALENYSQSSIDQSASGRSRWYQEPITRSLHTKCNLESTLSRMFLFLELRYVGGGGSLISRENTLTSAQLKYFCAVCMLRKQWRTTALLWLAIMQTLVKNPVGGASQNKKIRDRVDSGVKNGKWKLRVMGFWWYTISKRKNKEKNKQVKRVREFTRHKMSYASFSRDKGEVMLILVVWLACYSYGTN